MNCDIIIYIIIYIYLICYLLCHCYIMVEHLNAASNSHTEDILYVSQCEPSQSLVTCQVTNTEHLYLLYLKYVLKSENLLNVYLTYFQIETCNTIQLKVDNC